MNLYLILILVPLINFPYDIQVEDLPNPAPLCFYLNKERTKRLCISGEDVEGLENGRLINAELHLQFTKSDGSTEWGYIEGKQYIIDRNISIPAKHSGLSFDILIMAGEYEIKEKGVVILFVGKM